ncbi:ribosome maturation factor RimP [Nesterenkonia sp.]|uniref:ribosome maturation factor RimP n=1 Tax=Nesterenkonia sp. TaxID=704201 RepID=UPI00263A35F7|nr:ribosome maturation factor RimP [Nesterenkonia sp.]
MALPPRATSDSRFPDPRAAQLAPRLEPTVTAHGLYLEELALVASGARTVLKVVVDYETGTEQVDLDTLAGLSEALGVVLDKEADAEPLASVENYELEVTTPGATRPLTEPRHFRRNLGRLLEIERAGHPTMTARLREVDAAGITVSEVIPAPKKGMKPKTGPDTHIEFDSISRARVQVEFSVST